MRKPFINRYRTAVIWKGQKIIFIPKAGQDPRDIVEAANKIEKESAREKTLYSTASLVVMVIGLAMAVCSAVVSQYGFSIDTVIFLFLGGGLLSTIGAFTVYEIGNTIFSKKISRKIVKIPVEAAIYNASDEELELLEDLSRSGADVLAAAMKEPKRIFEKAMERVLEELVEPIEAEEDAQVEALFREAEGGIDSDDKAPSKTIKLEEFLAGV